ncbi:MAG: peroxiredoxin family protein [Bacteroidota bacterium]
MNTMYSKSIFFFLFVTVFVAATSAQTISGSFSGVKKGNMKLLGFNGLNTYPISSTNTDEQGRFSLSFAKSDYGVGCLIAGEDKPYFVILCNEQIEINGELPSIPESISILKGKQNIQFARYAREHPKRENTMSAWIFLEKIYNADTLFSVQKKTREFIRTEKKRILDEDSSFIANLDKGSYVSWYLPTRKMISSVSAVAQQRTWEMPALIGFFRNLDYTDARLYKSGILKDAIESHFWLLENSGRPLDSVFVEMQKSIDAMFVHLIKDPGRLNEITDYLFDLLERHSLFKASEYLALKVLNDVSCTINNDLARQLETYRAMKKGNTAPDIVFSDNPYAKGIPSAQLPKKLSDIKSAYTLVAFGAGWCPKCKEEFPQMAAKYANWKAQGMEVVFVSLDEDKTVYDSFVKDFPFLSVSDLKKWKGTVVNDYYVFGTPTLFLLDKNRKIVLRPNSVNQVDAWVDWYLSKGNPLPKN